jgi:predicted HicB family RNase H-like nuclease
MANKGTYNKEYYEKNKARCINHVKNYQTSKLAAFNIRLKPSLLAHYQDAANKAGMSFRGFVLAAIEEKIANMP